MSYDDDRSADINNHNTSVGDEECLCDRECFDDDDDIDYGNDNDDNDNGVYDDDEHLPIREVYLGMLAKALKIYP